nr:hypothetical protein [Notoacmeibacter marinus]
MLAFQFAVRGEDGLDKFAFRRVLEFKIQALDAGIAVAEFTAQLDMKFSIASETLQVVKDDDVSLIRLGAQISQQRDHAGPLHEIAAATDIIGKDRFDMQSFARRIFAAAMLL